MPVKWKIFFGLNLLTGLTAFVLLILLIVNSFDGADRKEDYFYLAIFIFSLSLMTLNGFLNIFLLQRFFPDKLIPVSIKRLHRVCGILTTLVTIFLLIAYGVAAANALATQNSNTKIVFLLLFFITALQLVVLIIQFQLPRIISHNNRNSMQSLIDSIGH